MVRRIPNCVPDTRSSGIFFRKVFFGCYRDLFRRAWNFTSRREFRWQNGTFLLRWLQFPACFNCIPSVTNYFTVIISLSRLQQEAASFCRACSGRENGLIVVLAFLARRCSWWLNEEMKFFVASDTPAICLQFRLSFLRYFYSGIAKIYLLKQEITSISFFPIKYDFQFHHINMIE